jgi:hypothetical protein
VADTRRDADGDGYVERPAVTTTARERQED